MYRYTHLDPNKWTNVRRCKIKNNHSAVAEKDNTNEPVIADIQQNETIALEMNTDNNCYNHKRYVKRKMEEED